MTYDFGVATGTPIAELHNCALAAFQGANPAQLDATLADPAIQFLHGERGLSIAYRPKYLMHPVQGTGRVMTGWCQYVAFADGLLVLNVDLPTALPARILQTSLEELIAQAHIGTVKRIIIAGSFKAPMATLRILNYTAASYDPQPNAAGQAVLDSIGIIVHAEKVAGGLIVDLVTRLVDQTRVGGGVLVGGLGLAFTAFRTLSPWHIATAILVIVLLFIMYQVWRSTRDGGRRGHADSCVCGPCHI